MVLPVLTTWQAHPGAPDPPSLTDFTSHNVRSNQGSGACTKTGLGLTVVGQVKAGKQHEERLTEKMLPVHPGWAANSSKGSMHAPGPRAEGRSQKCGRFPTGYRPGDVRFVS